MMSAQMLSAASNVSGTVADLAPGAKDGMRMLEAKAAQMAHLERPGKEGFDFSTIKMNEYMYIYVSNFVMV
jgi:enoyl reductase-like protein